MDGDKGINMGTGIIVIAIIFAVIVGGVIWGSQAQKSTIDTGTKVYNQAVSDIKVDDLNKPLGGGGE